MNSLGSCKPSASLPLHDPCMGQLADYLHQRRRGRLSTCILMVQQSHVRVGAVRAGLRCVLHAWLCPQSRLQSCDMLPPSDLLSHADAAAPQLAQRNSVTNTTCRLIYKAYTASRTLLDRLQHLGVFTECSSAPERAARYDSCAHCAACTALRARTDDGMSTVHHDPLENTIICSTVELVRTCRADGKHVEGFCERDPSQESVRGLTLCPKQSAERDEKLCDECLLPSLICAHAAALLFLAALVPLMTARSLGQTL